MSTMNRLIDKVALITGGESGIGLETARLFVAEGAKVHLAGIDAAKLRAAGDELGSDAATTLADVTDSAQVRRAVEEAVARFGRLDVVFSNAGISGAMGTSIPDYPEDVFTQVLNVHVLGAFHVLKHALPVMNDGGSIIITSSVVGLTGAPGACGYVTAKHAQVGLMRTAAREAAPRRIRVNTIHPGPTDTPFQEAIETTATGAPKEQAAEIFEQMIPLRRHASPQEIARSVLYLASDDSSFVTGATLAVDGGMSS
jgi:NAD(P)-dependent dehydrogenase (short-subunit alcohol dehydrogenase family)